MSGRKVTCGANLLTCFCSLLRLWCTSIFTLSPDSLPSTSACACKQWQGVLVRAACWGDRDWSGRLDL